MKRGIGVGGNPGSPDAGRSWSIILAGGEGERIRPFLRRWLGETRPKQYCTFLGSRSLLQHTVDRADVVAAPERRIVVAARQHEPHLREQMRGREGGRVLFQPNNRGTAPGIFLPLTYVLASDPKAMVTIYPSDHFVYPEEAFTTAVARSLAASTELGGRPIVLGVEADCREGDYGWIQPGAKIAGGQGQPLWNIDRFVEKPKHATARDFRGAFWNTFIITGSVQLLWRLGWRYLPEILSRFVGLWESVGKPEEPSVLRELYGRMPERDFSADVLGRAVRHLALMRLEGVYWSDWGREERVLETFRELDMAPPFAADRHVARTSGAVSGAVHEGAPEPLLP